MQRVLFAFLLICPLIGSAQLPRRFDLPAEIREASGLHIASYDSLWWHNDSGGNPTLYCTDAGGRLLDSIQIPGAVNRDWEDLSTDNAGNWYLGDFGNNRNNRRDLTIYRWAAATSQLDSIRFHYPEKQAFPPDQSQWNYNLEGFFWANDSLHLFTKNLIDKGNDFTRHYVLSDQPGVQAAHLVDSLYLHRRVVTAAALSPDGQRAALVAYTFRRWLGFVPYSAATLFVFEDFPDGRYLQGKQTAYRLRSWPLPTQFECVDFWDEQTVLVGSEATLWLPARVRIVKLK